MDTVFKFYDTLNYLRIKFHAFPTDNIFGDLLNASVLRVTFDIPMLNNFLLFFNKSVRQRYQPLSSMKYLVLNLPLLALLDKP